MPRFLDPSVEAERKANRRLEILSRFIEECKPDEKPDVQAKFDAAKVELATILYEQGNFGGALQALGDVDEPKLREMIKKRLG